MARTAAVIGGGVIGGGWAARFLLNGWDVRVFDPDPEAERKIGEVLANARLALPGLRARPMPAEGALSFHDTMAGAVAGAEWIAESVPERVELKQKVYGELQTAAEPGAVIGSSTSGFMPSELQAGAADPGQIVVTHPFNPVYLLPLVELVTTAANPARVAARAKDILSSLGMYPLHLRREIEAHIADRLLEAVWREGLWLVNDDIATTQEIDDAIRFGFGLRWAQMGLFETYRIAGGEAGMKHFIAQFGPTLALPWTKLMEVPELDETLVAKVSDQSDAQSGHLGIRELERIRDANLVSFLNGLKAQDWGAGAVLRAWDGAGPAPGPDEGPLLTLQRAVPLDWVDYNGHMNEARYLDAFGAATDRLMELVGCDAAYIASGGSYFTVETHIRHLDEVHAGKIIRVETQVLEGAGKKMHLFHRMYQGERLLATGEHMLLHVSLATRRSAPPSAAIAARLAEIAAAHDALGMPEAAGRVGR